MIDHDAEIIIVIIIIQKDECKGYFPVNRIRIVETVPEQTFKKQFCFQVC